MIVGFESLTLQWIFRVFYLNISYNFVDNVGFYSVGKKRKETHKIPTASGFRESAKSQGRYEMPLTLKLFELPTCAPYMTFRKL